MSDVEMETICRNAESSLLQAVTEALDQKRRLGQYAVIAENGQPLRIGLDEIARRLQLQSSMLVKAQE